MTKLISAGALFKCTSTNRYLLVMRSPVSSYPNRFCLVGGKIHNGEGTLEGLTREIVEEIGFVPTVEKWVPFNKFISNDNKFEYNSILVLTPNEFIPKLNKENSGYAWVDLEHLPRPLHPRLKEVLSSEILVDCIKRFT